MADVTQEILLQIKAAFRIFQQDTAGLASRVAKEAQAVVDECAVSVRSAEARVTQAQDAVKKLQRRLD